MSQSQMAMVRLTLMPVDPNSVPRSIFKDLPVTPLSCRGAACQGGITAGPPHLSVGSSTSNSPLFQQERP